MSNESNHAPGFDQTALTGLMNHVKGKPEAGKTVCKVAKEWVTIIPVQEMEENLANCTKFAIDDKLFPNKSALHLPDKKARLWLVFFSLTFP